MTDPLWEVHLKADDPNVLRSRKGFDVVLSVTVWILHRDSVVVDGEVGSRDVLDIKDLLAKPGFLRVVDHFVFRGGFGGIAQGGE